MVEQAAVKVAVVKVAAVKAAAARKMMDQIPAMGQKMKTGTATLTLAMVCLIFL